MLTFIKNFILASNGLPCKFLLLLTSMMITACSTVSDNGHHQIASNTSIDLYNRQFYLLAGLNEFNTVRAGNNQSALPKSLSRHHVVVDKPVTKISQPLVAPVVDKVVQNHVSIPLPRQYYLPQPVASAARIVRPAMPIVRATSIASMASESSTIIPVVNKKMMPILPIWSATQGQTLREVIENWAQQAGYQLVWDANYDYPIRAKLQFNLPFIDAIQRLFNAYLFADRPFLVDVYQHQKLVYVRAKDA